MNKLFYRGKHRKRGPGLDPLGTDPRGRPVAPAEEGSRLPDEGRSQGSASSAPHAAREPDSWTAVHPATNKDRTPTNIPHPPDMPPLPR